MKEKPKPNKGLLFVLSAPAGTGKTTLVQKLAKEFPNVVQSISYTTRKKRGLELCGDDYHFITVPEFEQKIKEHEFLEYVLLYGDYYGTSKVWVEKNLEKGKHVFLIIDTQGALQLMDKLEACYIFVLPPSIKELRIRLEARGTDSKEAIERRLKIAHDELNLAKFYQYHIINDKLETAYDVLRSIVIAEEHRNRLDKE